MLPDDVVLVALIKSTRDLDLLRQAGWYRIPVRHAPRHFSGAQYLAPYLAGAFRDLKWSVREIADVRGHELVRRRDLIPEEEAHPRAEELYYKLQVGPLVPLACPIVSKRGRRLLFIWTTGEKFERAREINDLLGKSKGDDDLWQEIQAAGLDAERQILVREGRSRYRFDYLVHCPKGRLGITLGARAPSNPPQSLRTLMFRDLEHEHAVAEAMRRVRRVVRELGGGSFQAKNR